MKKKDCRELALLHQKAFPGHFLSSLGTPFLEQFYLGFVNEPSAVTVVHRSSTDKLVGVAVGTTEPARFYRRLLLKRGMALGATALWAAMRNPRVLIQLLRRFRHRGEVLDAPTGALLSSICVDPASSGQGIGTRVLGSWTDQLKKAGGFSAYLTTDADENKAVRAFYERQGWFLELEYVTAESRMMARYRLKLNATAFSPQESEEL